MKPIWVINLVPARAGGEERLDQEWRHLGAITKHLRYVYCHPGNAPLARLLPDDALCLR